MSLMEKLRVWAYEQQKHRRGFTLMELLLVIAIIAILFGVIAQFINIPGLLLSAQDREREHHRKQLENALYARLVDKGALDTGIPDGESNKKPICKPGVTGDPLCVNLDALIPGYVQKLPQDPLATGNSTGYEVYQNVGRVHVVAAHMGGGGSGGGGPPTITIVDSGNRTANVIARGGDGFPVIAYSYSNDDLKVLKCGNAACNAGNTITTVDSASDFRYISIAVPPDDLPIILYNDVVSSQYKVVKCGDAACSSSAPPTTVADGVGENSIAISAGSLPIIALAGADGITVMKCGNAACSAGNSTVSAGNGALMYPSIAIGADGFPVIAATEIDQVFFLGKPVVVKCGNAACSAGNTTATVDDPVDGGYYPSIAIGSDGFPVVTSSANAEVPLGGELRFVQCGNAACSAGNTVRVVDRHGSFGYSATVKIGSDNLPVISEYDSTNRDLKVVKCGDANCNPAGNTIVVVDTVGNGNMGFPNSLAIGADGFPVIVARETNPEAFLGNLVVVKCGNAGCTLP